MKMILSSATLQLLPASLAVMAYVVSSVLHEGSSSSTPGRPKLIWAALTLGWLAHAIAITLDTFTFTGPQLTARFGFAPALSVTSWLVLSVYALESHRLELPVVRRSLARLAAFCVAISWAFPGQEHPSSASALDPLHWILGFASYGLIGVALMHAALMRHAENQLRAKPTAGAPQALGMPLLKLESLTLRFVAMGFAMLTLTLLLGMSSSHSWRWDHKAIFSVLAWLVFAMLLLGRYRFGWRGRQAVRWLYAGSGLLLLAYVGSRFVMEVLLHRPVAT